MHDHYHQKYQRDGAIRTIGHTISTILSTDCLQLRRRTITARFSSWIKHLSRQNWKRVIDEHMMLAYVRNHTSAFRCNFLDQGIVSLVTDAFDNFTFTELCLLSSNASFISAALRGCVCFKTHLNPSKNRASFKINFPVYLYIWYRLVTRQIKYKFICSSFVMISLRTITSRAVQETKKLFAK